MEEKLEEVVEETTQQETPVKEEPKIDDKIEKIKIKKKPSMEKLNQEDNGIIKVDLNKPPKPIEENEVKKDNADDGGVVAESKDAESTQEQEEVQPESETQETPVLEEITEEGGEEEVTVEATHEQVDEAIAESEATG